MKIHLTNVLSQLAGCKYIVFRFNLFKIHVDSCYNKPTIQNMLTISFKTLINYHSVYCCLINFSKSKELFPKIKIVGTLNYISACKRVIVQSFKVKFWLFPFKLHWKPAPFSTTSKQNPSLSPAAATQLQLICFCAKYLRTE